MYLNYQRLEKALVEARANIAVLQATTEAEVAYNRWREIEAISRREARQIKYSASSIANSER